MRRLALASFAVVWQAGYLLPAAEGAPAARLDRSLTLSTDTASFFLFEPQTLEHRRTSPMGWESYDFAASREFAAGNLVAFCTGGDGAYRLRITDGALAPLEQQRSNGSWSFRLKVRHGRVLLDNGDHLPCEATADETDEDLFDLGKQWITLAPGSYQVTVHAISRPFNSAARRPQAQGPHGALPDYVIALRRIEKLESIKSSRMPPMLDRTPGVRPVEMKSITEFRRYEEDLTAAVPKQAPALIVSDGPVVPGFYARLPVTDEFHDAVEGKTSGGTNAPRRIKQVVLIDSVKTPTVGVLAVPSGASRREDEPWRINFAAKRLVKVNRLARGKLSLQGEIAPLVRRMNASPGQLDALKAEFAVYARKNPAYRAAIDYPDFEAERIAAMTSAPGLINLLIHHVQMPADLRRRLLAISDTERVRELTSLARDSE